MIDCALAVVVSFVYIFVFFIYIYMFYFLVFCIYAILCRAIASNLQTLGRRRAAAATTSATCRGSALPAHGTNARIGIAKQSVKAAMATQQ